MVQDVKPGGIFMINCQWTDEELDIILTLKLRSTFMITRFSFTQSTLLIRLSKSVWVRELTQSYSLLSLS